MSDKTSSENQLFIPLLNFLRDNWPDRYASGNLYTPKAWDFKNWYARREQGKSARVAEEAISQFKVKYANQQAVPTLKEFKELYLYLLRMDSQNVQVDYLEWMSMDINREITIVWYRGLGLPRLDSLRKEEFSRVSRVLERATDKYTKAREHDGIEITIKNVSNHTKIVYSLLNPFISELKQALNIRVMPNLRPDSDLKSDKMGNYNGNWLNNRLEEFK